MSFRRKRKISRNGRKRVAFKRAVRRIRRVNRLRRGGIRL